MDDNTKSEIVENIAKDVYKDVGSPVAKPTGELMALVPRAIKAALNPLEKWILQKEYNVEETKKLLEDKLKNVPPELIQQPEPHIAVPALQYISYCMDNEELRGMYANLLANSMNEVMKNGVHPGFVEIIKQLCPDEAKILKYMAIQQILPTISLRRENEKGEGFDVINDFSNVGELTHCESPFDTSKYFDNLIRLGLVQSARGLRSLINKNVYEPLKSHALIVQYKIDIEQKNSDYNETRIVESFVELTDYGKAFCNICI